jgi:hypothetical protein
LIGADERKKAPTISSIARLDDNCIAEKIYLKTRHN